MESTQTPSPDVGTPVPPRISYWLKSNRYAKPCFICATQVDKDAGWIQKQGDAWQTICHPCVQSHARAYPQLRNGQPQHLPALNGSNSGGELYTCTKCETDVVLVKGAKSGKWFFCRIVGGQTGIRYAAHHIPHTAEDCEATQRDRAERDAGWEALEAERAKRAERYARAEREMEAEGINITGANA